MPAINKNAEYLLVKETFPAINKSVQINTLNIAQKILVTGADNPVPGGLAKGVGKESPFIPWIR